MSIQDDIVKLYVPASINVLGNKRNCVLILRDFSEHVLPEQVAETGREGAEGS